MPVIRVKLGDTVDAIKAKSSFDFSPIYFGDAGTVFEADYNFAYDHAERGFVLEGAKYIGLSTTLGQVYSIALAPHQGTLSARETWDFCEQLIGKFDKGGWKRDPFYEEVWERTFPSFERLVKVSGL